MATHDELSSTERLLNVIKEPTRGDERSADRPADSPPRRRGFSLRPFPSGKGITVGIDIGYTDLKLVKIRQVSAGQWKLIDYLSLPFNADAPKGSPEFPRFLHSALQGFGAVSKKIQVWCSMSAARVEVSHIRIPKVPKKQIPNVVYFTVKRENSLDEETQFLDFEVQGEVMASGVPKLRVLYYTAPRKEVDDIRRLFSRAGLHLTGVSIGPFANQNLIRTNWVPTANETSGSLYIGRDWSRIDIFSEEGFLVLTRGIKAGMNSMVESLMEEFNERGNQIPGPVEPSERSGESGEPDSTEITFAGLDNERPAPIEIDMASISLVPEGEEDAGDAGEVLPEVDFEEPLPAESAQPREPVVIDFEQAGKILKSLNPEAPQLTGDEPGFELTEHEKFEMALPAVDRLVRQLERTFGHYTETLGMERVRKIFISGGIDGYRPLVDYVGDQLGLARDSIDPLDPQNPSLGDVVPPESMGERLSYTLATGLALADNSRTPNLIFPYEEKQKVVRVNRFNNLIFVVFLFMLAVSGGYYLWQERLADKKQSAITGLRAEASRYGTRVSKAEVLKLMAAVNKNQADIKRTCARYGGVAVIGELSLRTPPHMRLLTVRGSFGPVSPNAEKPPPKTMVIEGFILGDPKKFEPNLGGYLVKLESSPLMSSAVVQKTEVVQYHDEEALRFTLKVDLT